ncbi:MAG TPA: hypothetical protein VE621_07290 [Bryobacteraceae bacterium]|nr:hypothetical protein [Bryobacteraceae bacterium]
MTPRAEVQHEIAGRIRFRVPEKRSDQGYFDWVAGAIREFPGVEAVQAKPLTGSILVLHRTESEKILQMAQAAELFHVAPPEPRVLPTATAHRLLDQVDARINTATRGGWDFDSVLMLACAVAGGLQVYRQNVWPAAASMFWYALTLAEKNGVRGRRA